MADSLRPLTLLLGAAALWALCMLVLALGGLGTRFPAPEAGAAPPPLPKVSLTPTRSRLGAWESYAEVGARPLLNEGRKPAAVAAIAAEAGSSELDVTLTSVLITSRLQMAVLTDNKDGSSKRVKLGEAVEGSAWRLLSLEPRQAVLEGPSGQRVLPLRVYDGTSGEAPTQVANAEPAQPAPPVQPVQPAQTPNQLARSPQPAPVAQNASPAATVQRPEPEQMSQEQQVEAIRQRIEARRAQMRAEAEAAAANQNNNR